MIDKTKPLGPQIAIIIEAALAEAGLGYSKTKKGRTEIGFCIGQERRDRCDVCSIGITSMSRKYDRR